MRLPSLAEVLSSGAMSILRFPLASIIALLWTLSMLNVIHGSGFSSAENLVLTCVFGFSLALAVDVFCEAHKFKMIFKLIGRIVVVLLLVLFWFSFFSEFSEAVTLNVLEFFLMESASLLLLLLSPYLFTNRNEGFWAYGLKLLARFAQTFSYFAILFFGIVLLLSSFDYLLGFYIDEKIYFDVWTIIVGFLATVFFMAGVPKDFEGLANAKYSQDGSGLLVNYVLTPLAFLYLIVLYIYTGKILYTWQWPEGDVSIWIIVFSLASVFNYFFAYGQTSLQNYVKFFQKWLFYLLIPLVFVLFMAVGLRIADYGFTEERYLIVAFGLWLLLSSLYFALFRGKDIRVIPVLLLIVTMLATWGPVSAFNISVLSQTARFEKALEENGMLVDGKIVAIENIDVDEAYELKGILNYLVYYHGVDSIQKYFSEPFSEGLSSYKLLNEVEVKLGLERSSDFRYDGSFAYEYVSFYADSACTDSSREECPVYLADFDYYLPLSFDSYSNFLQFDFNGYDLRILSEANGSSILLKFDSEEVLVLDLADLISSLNASKLAFDEVPHEKLIFPFSGEGISGELRLKTLSVRMGGVEDPKLDFLDGYIVFSLVD